MKLKFKLFLILSLAVLLPACKDKDKEQHQGQIPQVQAIKLVPHNVALSFEYPARAKGFKDTEVRARVGGILLSRNYVEGSEVEEGDVLFQIDPEPYKASLIKAKGSLADVEANLRAAISKLYKEKIVSEKSRDDARAQMDALKASAEAARGEVTTAQLNLDYTSVKAPISGTTSLGNKSDGSLITINEMLTTITQLKPIYIMFSVSDIDIFKMKRMASSKQISGMKENSIIAKLKFSDGSFYEHNGEVNFINPTIDSSTGTVTLRAVFPNPKKLIMPQQFVRIIIDGIEMPNALTVPKEAVLQGPKGTFVYIVNEEGKVDIAQIETSLSTKDEMWAVEKGLKPGDVVITAGLMKVRQGIPVQPVFAEE